MNYPYNPQMNYQPMMNNPYLDRLQQNFQQTMPTVTQPIAPTIKVVNDFNEITASDVPMTSPFSLFVKNDMTEIKLGKWNANGTIGYLSFKGVEDEKTNNDTPMAENLKYEPSDAFLEVLNDRFDKLEKLMQPKTSTRRKESDE